MRRSSLVSRLLKISSEVHSPPSVLTKEEILLKESLESSFYAYFQWAWEILEPVPLKLNWHLKASCEFLELVYSCDIEFLIINMPPGCSKSSLLQIFQTWVWVREPNLRFLCLSGSHDLSQRDAFRAKSIIDSDEYRKFWGKTAGIRRDANAKKDFTNLSKGSRRSSSIHASVRGHDGNFVLCDDPNVDDDIFSKVMREKVNEYMSSNVYERSRGTDSLGNKRHAIVICMQRLHDLDVSGYAESNVGGTVVKLVLPMEFESNYKCKVEVKKKDGSVFRFEDPRTVEGELLWPEYISARDVEIKKKNLGNMYSISSQLQQRPSPEEGGILKKDYFSLYDGIVPIFQTTLVSFDTAISIGTGACESACTVWGLFSNNQGILNILLLNSWSGRLAYPDLKAMMVRFSKDYTCNNLHAPLAVGNRPKEIWIEKAANGGSFIQDLQRSGLNVHSFEPKTYGYRNGDGVIKDASKEARAMLAADYMKAGFVYVPKDMPKYASDLVTASLRFPRGATGKDLVDSMTQAILIFSKRFDLNYQQEERERSYDEIRRETKKTYRFSPRTYQ